MNSFVSPSRYVQEAGVLSALGGHVARFGDRAMLVADDDVVGILSERVEESFADVDATYAKAEFGGECTHDEIDRLSEVARQTAPDVIIGAGGGKAIDVAKSVRARVDAKLISLPTVASTDAPTSGLSVIYDDTGSIVKGEVHERRPDLVLVDTRIIAEAPTRWFVSGVGDALATKFEAVATDASGGQTVAGGSPTQAGLALANRCYDVLDDHALAATEAVGENAVTADVERTVEAIILLSGLGFENGGLAAAHAVHDGISAAVETDATHGEKVGFGVFTQFALEQKPESETREVVRFAHEVGLPVTLRELGVPEDRVDAVAEATCEAESITNQPGNPTPEDVRNALLTADKLGDSFDRERSDG